MWVVTHLINGRSSNFTVTAFAVLHSTPAVQLAIQKNVTDYGPYLCSSIGTAHWGGRGSRGLPKPFDIPSPKQTKQSYFMDFKPASFNLIIIGKRGLFEPQPSKEDSARFVLYSLIWISQQ
jgi:hypothetical protein